MKYYCNVIIHHYFVQVCCPRLIIRPAQIQKRNVKNHQCQMVTLHRQMAQAIQRQRKAQLGKGKHQQTRVLQPRSSTHKNNWLLFAGADYTDSITSASSSCKYIQGTN